MEQGEAVLNKVPLSRWLQSNEPGPPPPGAVFSVPKGERVESNVTMDGARFNKNTNERTWQWEVRWSAVNWETINDAWLASRAWNYTDLNYLLHLRAKGQPLPTADQLDEMRGKTPKIKVAKRPILCIGSGASLNRALPLLHKWKGDIICSTSQASSLVHAGKPPTYILALDHESNPGEILTPDDWDEYPDTWLITHPGVNPDLLSYWGGRMLLFRKLQDKPPFYQVEQRIQYSRDDFNEFHGRDPGDWDLKSLTDYPHEGAENRRFYGPRGKGPNITAVIPSMGSSGAGQMQFAHELGYSPIFFVGLDFGPARFSRWRWWADDWHQETAPDGEVGEGAPVPADYVQADNGVWASFLNIYYKRNIINAWRLSIADLIQTCPLDKTSLDEPPYVPIEEVIKRQGQVGGSIQPLTRRETITVCDQYHAKHNTYVVQFEGNGLHFVEIPPSNEPLSALEAYIAQIEALRKAGQLPANLPQILKDKTLRDTKRVLAQLKR